MNGALRFLLHSFLPVAKTRVSLSTPGLIFNIQSKLRKCPACSNLDDGRRKQLLWAPTPCPLTPAVPGCQSLPPPPSLARSFASSSVCINQLHRLRDCVFWCCLCVQSRAASWTHVSLPFTAYSTPSTSPANRFVSVGPRDPSFVNIPQQTQVGRSHLFRMWCSVFYWSGAV